MVLIRQIGQDLMDKHETQQTSCIEKNCFGFEFIFAFKYERMDFMEISRKRLIFPIRNNEERKCIKTKYGTEMNFK